MVVLLLVSRHRLSGPYIAATHRRLRRELLAATVKGKARLEILPFCKISRVGRGGFALDRPGGGGTFAVKGPLAGSEPERTAT
jgi:hypothetical protein